MPATAPGPLAKPGSLDDLGGSPVEMLIRELLTTPLDEAARMRLQALQRKLDIGRRLVQRYADNLGAALGDEEISPRAYQALAEGFTTLATCEVGADESTRGVRLRLVNSAFNCLDKLDERGPQADRLAELRSRLERLATEVAQCPSR